MMVISNKHMFITPEKFWKLTFAEWRPLYDDITGKSHKMSRKDSEDLIAKYKQRFKGPKDGKS
jgi:hypothetical protein